jgi:hypothetical protein
MLPVSEERRGEKVMATAMVTGTKAVIQQESERQPLLQASGLLQ